MATFFLPFDHRSGFASDIMHTRYPYSSADRLRAQELKRVIYDAFLLVYPDVSTGDILGILVDEETGGSLLLDAHQRGILSALTLEASGEPHLRLQYGDQSSHRLRMIGTSLGKVLLRFSQIPTKEDPQLQTLQYVCAQLAHAGQRVLIELLSSGSEEERETFLTQTITSCTEMGIAPEFWKVESLPSSEAWKRVKDVLQPSSGLLLLGRGEDAAHVAHAVRIAAASNAVEGFAIGRTLFAEELRALLSGKKKRDAVVHAIADHFRSLISLWKSV